MYNPSIVSGLLAAMSLAASVSAHPANIITGTAVAPEPSLATSASVHPTEITGTAVAPEPSLVTSASAHPTNITGTAVAPDPSASAFGNDLSTRALGINCEGSANCKTFGNSQIAVSLTSAIDQHIDPNRWYNNGQLIACIGTGAPITGNGAFCAFLQYTGGTWGSVIKSLAHYIEHNCKVCGSVPYYYPGDNDVTHGELTYNYVSNGCTKETHAVLC